MAPAQKPVISPIGPNTHTIPSHQKEHQENKGRAERKFSDHALIASKQGKNCTGVYYFCAKILCPFCNNSL
jgi:hypothetical protein